MERRVIQGEDWTPRSVARLMWDYMCPDLTLAGIVALILTAPIIYYAYDRGAEMKDRLERYQAAALQASTSTSTPTPQTWYVRVDGGTPAQCSGLVDAPYNPQTPSTSTPTSPSSRDCALSHPFYLWTDDPPSTGPAETPKWKIAGGDTVVIGPGDYGMGWKTPAYSSTAWWNYVGCRGNNHGCYNPPIPAGTKDRPTRIVGVGWDSGVGGHGVMGCKDGPKARLVGRGAVSALLSLYDTQYVDVECLEFTDAAQCRLATLTGEPYGCVNYSDNYGYWGVQTNLNTQHITLTHLSIHGMASVGVYGAVGGDVVARDLTVSGNGNFGWDFDPGGGVASHGPVTFDGGLVEWSGCVEAYPLTPTQPRIVGCYDQAGANANGDGIGLVEMDGDLVIRNVVVRYNAQDGIDALYPKSLTSLTIEDSQIYDNEGQIIKTPGAGVTTIRRNILVSGCERMVSGVEGVTAPDYARYLKGPCRGSDGVALMFKPHSTVRFEYNSMATYAPTAFNIQCRPLTDSFTSQGRLGWDGVVDSTQALTGKVRDYHLTSNPTYIGATGAVWVYPRTGTRYGKRVGLKGAASCYGGPCQFYYDPTTNTLSEDPMDDPPPADSEMRVDYQSSQACGDTITLSFQNNVVRGWPRPSTGVNGGAFWMQTWPTGQAHETWAGNFYCGLRNPTPHPGETWVDKCPGGWWSREPMTLTTGADLQVDVTPLIPSSPLIKAAVAIPDYPTTPTAPSKDVGAVQMTKGDGGNGGGDGGTPPPGPGTGDGVVIQFYVDKWSDGTVRVRNMGDDPPPGSTLLYTVTVNAGKGGTTIQQPNNP